MCEIELRLKREILYQRFADLTNSSELFSLQRSIAEYILDCEKNLSENDNEQWKIHLEKLLFLGDSIVWLLLDPFTIRQLGKYEAVYTSLANQGDVIINVLNACQEKSNDHYYLVADITRCITVGDIIEVFTQDRVRIIEFKSTDSKNLTVQNILRGRFGRQFSKAFWLHRYMQNGFGKLFGYKYPSKTIKIDAPTDSHIDLIPSLVKKCIRSRTAYIKAESGLIYIAQVTESEPNFRILSNLQIKSECLLGSTARLLEEPKTTTFHAPPLVFNIPLEYRIMLQEVDINIYTLIEVDYLKEVCRNYGFDYCQTTEGPQLTKDGKSQTFDIRFINDILISFATVNSAVEIMTMLFEKIKDLNDYTPEETKLLENHPQSKAEFAKYLEDSGIVAFINNDT